MMSYVFRNFNSNTAIVERAKVLFGLDVITEGNNVLLGNDKMMIDVEPNITRITIYDITVNVKALRDFILGKSEL